jgi:hypothetical protein
MYIYIYNGKNNRIIYIYIHYIFKHSRITSKAIIRLFLLFIIELQFLRV